MSQRLDYREIQEYLKSLIPGRPEELREMEERAARESFPIIGPVCGYFCYQVARMVSARNIFELGSGFGYSTAWFAMAVRDNGGGRVHHVVWDEKLSQEARGHIDRLGLGEFVEYRVGEAVGVLKEHQGGLDIVFSDIDKEGYPGSIPVILEKLRPGGVFIADNLLWSGRIFDALDETPATEGIRLFTARIAKDERWVSSIVPFRDGLLLAWKRP